MSLLENDFSVDYSTFTTGTKDMKDEDTYVSISIILRNHCGFLDIITVDNIAIKI